MCVVLSKLKVTSHFVNEYNQSLSSEGQDANLNLILRKFFVCLKSQHNLNGVTFSIRLVIANSIHFLLVIQSSEHPAIIRSSKSNRPSWRVYRVYWDLLENHQIWSIVQVKLEIKVSEYIFIVFCYLRSFANIYMEFFKNLPNSFSPKSNYQVSVLFWTIQTESTKSVRPKTIIVTDYWIFSWLR